jgi:hypothetical protein
MCASDEASYITGVTLPVAGKDFGLNQEEDGNE